MKKFISVLLAAVLLSLGAVCAMAADSKPVSGEPSSVVIVDFLASLQDTDNESVTVKRNENGSVTLTFKKDASEDTPIHLADYTGAQVDLSKPTFVAADFVSENKDVDFRIHYTRKDKDGGNADLFFTGMKKNASYTKRSTDTSIVWDLPAYVTGDKRFENNVHEFKDLDITAAKTGDVVTLNTLALVSDENAMVVGTPLVKPSTGSTSSDSSSAGSTDSSSTDSSSTDSSSTDSSSTDSSSTDSTGSTGSTDSSSTDSTGSTGSTGSTDSTGSTGSTSSTGSTGSTGSASSTGSTGSTSSGGVQAGDTGLLVFAVLAILGAVGAAVTLRIRTR